MKRDKCNKYEATKWFHFKESPQRSILALPRRYSTRAERVPKNSQMFWITYLTVVKLTVIALTHSISRIRKFNNSCALIYLEYRYRFAKRI